MKIGKRRPVLLAWIVCSLLELAVCAPFHVKGLDQLLIPRLPEALKGLISKDDLDCNQEGQFPMLLF